MLDSLSLVAATDSGSSLGVLLVYLIVAVIGIVAAWKVYAKAGKPGWAAIIPIYNVYVLLKIVGRPGWWLILFLIPFVNFVVSIIVAIDLAKAFGKSTAFGVVGLWLFSLIGYLILAFGDATYQGSPTVVAADPAPSAPAPSEQPAAPEAPAQEVPAAETPTVEAPPAEEAPSDDTPQAPKPPVVQ